MGPLDITLDNVDITLLERGCAPCRLPYSLALYWIIEKQEMREPVMSGFTCTTFLESKISVK